MTLAKAVPADVWPGLGLAGGLVMLGIILATVALWQNMNRQIKKVKLPTEAEVAEQDRAERAARKIAPDSGRHGIIAGGPTEPAGPGDTAGSAISKD